MHAKGKATRWITALMLLSACVAQVGCVTFKDPGAEELRVPANPSLDVVGSRGPLSQAQAAAVLRQLKLEAPDADMLKVHIAVEQAVAGSPLYTGNSARLLRDGAETFPAMFAAIRSARRSIYLEYYIFEDVAWDGVHISDLLADKCAEGVEVALIYDAVGSVGTDAALFEKLRAAGVRVLAFSPVNPLKRRFRWSINDRDHRKMLVADDRVALLGGINMATTYESAPSHRGSSEAPAAGAAPTYWRDTDLEIRGPAVAELVKLYRAHWLEQGGQPLSAAMDGSTPAEGSDVIRIVGSSPDAFAPRYYATVLSAINTAERSVWLTSAYFVPTHQEKSALAAAAKRGVDVRLLLPSHSDSKPSLAVQRSTYSDLLEAGVHIFERDGVILHSKTIVVDGVWAVIGSSNFDHRSVLFNDEVDAVVLGNDTATAFEDVFRDDLASAHAIDRREWAHRSLGERLREMFWRVSTTML